MPHVKKEALKFLSTSSSLCYSPEGINDLKQRLEAKPKKFSSTKTDLVKMNCSSLNIVKAV
jgi:hypothetical protein